MSPPLKVKNRHCKGNILTYFAIALSKIAIFKKIKIFAHLYIFENFSRKCVIKIKIVTKWKKSGFAI